MTKKDYAASPLATSLSNVQGETIRVSGYIAKVSDDTITILPTLNTGATLEIAQKDIAALKKPEHENDPSIIYCSPSASISVHADISADELSISADCRCSGGSKEENTLTATRAKNRITPTERWEDCYLDCSDDFPNDGIRRENCETGCDAGYNIDIILGRVLSRMLLRA